MGEKAGSRPHVAIITHEEDLHAYAVRRELRERHAVDCAIIETSRLREGPALNWSPVGTGGGAGLSVLPDAYGGAVDLREVDAVWLRRLGNPKGSSVYADIQDPAHQDLIHNDSLAAVLGMALTDFAGVWVDDPGAIREAENKLVQLRAASRATGLRVPRTLVSADPERIRGFCAEVGPTVIKPVRGTPKAPMVTAEVTPALLADDAAMRLSPAIYQELVPGPRHVRVHCFGDRIEAALLESPDLDWRPNLAIPSRPHHLPEEVVGALRQVLAALRLTMGIFDLKITDAGEYVWLEVNPQGQFLFVEAMCGLPLIAAMAEFLAERARSGAAAAAPESAVAASAG